VHVTPDKTCRREMLAHRGPFQIEACNCGLVHLTIAFMTVRIAPAAVDTLCAALLEAVQKLERPGAVAH
jgi:hypothetical protein